MTEQTTDTVENTETVPTVDPMTLVPDAVRPLVQVTKDLWDAEVGKANAIADKLRAAGNVTALVHEMRDTADTTDEMILAYRKWMDEINEQILANQATVEAHIKSAGLIDTAEIDEDALKAEYTEIANRLKGLRKSAENFIKDEDARNAVFGGLKNLTAAPGTRVSSGTGRGAGGEKARLSKIVVDGQEIFESTIKDGEEIRTVTLTVLASWMSKDSGVKVESSQIREAAIAAGNVSRIAELNGRPVTFSFTAGDKTYREVTLTPKSDK